MLEKEPQFFRPGVKEREPQKETEIERKRRLGLESEWTLALPLFQDLKRDGVLSSAEHTAKKVDEERGIDFVLGMEDGSHLAVQLSTSESPEIWEKKIKRMVGGMGAKPIEELKDIFPKPELLSRIQKIERVPKIPLRIDPETVDRTYKRFEQSGSRGAPIDYLSDPAKEEIKKELVSQALKVLGILSSDKGFARRFPELPSLARQRQAVLNKSYLEFIQKQK